MQLTNSQFWAQCHRKDIAAGSSLDSDLFLCIVNKIYFHVYLNLQEINYIIQYSTYRNFLKILIISSENFAIFLTLFAGVPVYSPPPIYFAPLICIHFVFTDIIQKRNYCLLNYCGLPGFI